MKDETEQAIVRAKPQDIRDRAIEYSLRAVRLYQHLLKEGGDAGRILGKQFLRSATSIGANLVEALSGESRKDFIHKYSIAQKEARESKYWLTLLQRSDQIGAQRLDSMLDETEQLIAILTKIIVNSKKSLRR